MNRLSPEPHPYYKAFFGKLNWVLLAASIVLFARGQRETAFYIVLVVIALDLGTVTTSIREVRNAVYLTHGIGWGDEE